MQAKRYKQTIQVTFTAKDIKEANAKMLNLVIGISDQTMIITAKGKIKELPF